ncbi:MAG: acyl-CoA thioesterase [Candidatus Delongbacteria bacterium]|nr:acyl-CoA thioesterase [Candidatus Delongbacteria bacterium]
MAIFRTPLTVRYVETDRMGIVHHSHYFAWFEVGRTDFIASSGLHYRQAEEQGFLMPLIDCGCRFIQAAHYEDPLIIVTRVDEIRFARIAFHYEVFRDDRLLADGFTRHAFVNEKLQPINVKRTHPEIWDIMHRLWKDEIPSA